MQKLCEDDFVLEDQNSQQVRQFDQGTHLTPNPLIDNVINLEDYS
jgi:hypothetical protein